MQKTIYFTGVGRLIGQLSSEISTVTQIKDEWVKDNLSKIGKIEREDIKITPYGGNNGHAIVVLQLTYYSK